MQKKNGFTLIELMIVVMIIGILSAIAYPSYQEFVVRSNRSAAQQFMLEVASREEQYMLDTRTYTATIGDGGLQMTIPDEVSNFYTISDASGGGTAGQISVSAGPPPTFTIYANPIAGTMQENDSILSLDSTGQKTPADLW